MNTSSQEMIFSYSRLALFNDCRYRWFLKYIEKIEEDNDTTPLMLGKAVHKAIEEKMLGKSDKLALIEGWREVDYFDLNLDEYQSLFHNSHVEMGEGNSPNVSVEYHFELPLDGEGSPKVQGYIDVIKHIFGTYSITDWKTNRVMYEPMDNMQLALYAWALSKIHNVPSVTGTLFFLRFFKNNRKTVTFNAEDMEKARTWALNLAHEALTAIANYEKGTVPFEECFPATPNHGCAYCPFAVNCTINYPKTEKGKCVG